MTTNITIIKRLDGQLADGKVTTLNAWLDARQALPADADVKAEVEAYLAAFTHTTIAVKSAEMNLSACKILLDHFGSRAKVDKAINNYNDKADRPSYNPRTLVDKLVPNRKPAPKGKGKDVKRLEKAVSEGIITQAQMDLIMALKVS